MSMLLLFSLPFFLQTISSTSTSGPFHPKAIQSFLKSRCSSSSSSSSSSSAIWSYKGALYDPIHDNKKIAQVEGVEIAHSLFDCFNEGKETQKNLHKLNNLRVRHVLYPLQNPKKKKKEDASEGKKELKQWDYAATILSRKLFLYRSPSKSTPKLLNFIRIRPNGPKRYLKVSEATALYETVTTFVSRNEGKEMLVFTEWPDGHVVCGMARSSSSDADDADDGTIRKRNENGYNNDPLEPIGLDDNGAVLWDDTTTDTTITRKTLQKHWNQQQQQNKRKQKATATMMIPKTQKPRTFEFDVYAKRTTLPYMNYSLLLPTLQHRRRRSNKQQHHQKEEEEEEEEVIVSPPRSKFIQFGQDKTSSAKYASGARETYAYTFTPPAASLAVKGTERSIFSFLPFPFSKQKAQPQKEEKQEREEEEECKVRYTRYGESPPWYGIQRMCTLELIGQKIVPKTTTTTKREEIRNALPPTVASIMKRVPTFFNVLPNIDPFTGSTTLANKNDDDDIISTIQSFQQQQEKQQQQQQDSQCQNYPLKIEPIPEKQKEGKRRILSQKMEECVDFGYKIGRRLKDATSFSSL